VAAVPSWNSSQIIIVLYFSPLYWGRGKRSYVHPLRTSLEVQPHALRVLPHTRLFRSRFWWSHEGLSDAWRKWRHSEPVPFCLLLITLSDILARIIQPKALVASGFYPWLKLILKGVTKKFHIWRRNSSCCEREPTRENKVYKISTYSEIILCFVSFQNFFCPKIKIWRNYFPNALYDKTGRTTGWRGVVGKKTRRIIEWQWWDTKGVNQCTQFWSTYHPNFIIFISYNR
jgi:hypothetical protein